MARSQLTFADVNLTVTVPAGPRVIEISDKDSIGPAGSHLPQNPFFPGFEYSRRSNEHFNSGLAFTAGLDTFPVALYTFKVEVNPPNARSQSRLELSFGSGKHGKGRS